jgi:hypothetical protein|nr:MAG TPA: hypothetical protein [Caudoviricetes sp.]
MIISILNRVSNIKHLEKKLEEDGQKRLSLLNELREKLLSRINPEKSSYFKEKYNFYKDREHKFSVRFGFYGTEQIRFDISFKVYRMVDECFETEQIGYYVMDTKTEEIKQITEDEYFHKRTIK